MQPPPPLPDRRLRRLLAIARMDGWSIVLVGAVGGAWALWQHAWAEAAAAGLVLAAGAGELQGHARLQRGDPRGMDWLVRAQFCLLGIIWAYAWWRWRTFDPATFWAQMPAMVRAELDRQMFEAGLEPALDRPYVLAGMNLMVCTLLAFLTLLYQGGLALYYTFRRRAVTEALLASPPPLP